jgi:histidyl-tRNA synthetase
MRAYLANQGDGAAVRWYYLGPMFRSERPQAGRKRQFHQLGAEAIGSDSAIVDAEMVGLTYDLCRAVGLGEARVLVNSIGSEEDQAAIKQLLETYFSRNKDDLCEDCTRRLEGNILRILDCKNPQCQSLIDGAPPLADALGESSRQQFDRVCRLLDQAGVPFQTDNRLVRGLDYYTRTVWEIRHDALGAQDALGGGGRYDRLAESLGQKARRPGVGFAMGLERMILAIQAAQEAPAVQAESRPDVWLVSMGKAAEDANFLLARTLRAESKLTVQGDFDGRSMKAQMRMANRSGARWVVICGDDELSKGVFCTKDLVSGEQVELSKTETVNHLVRSSAVTV